MIQRWELLGAPQFHRDEADVQQDLEHWHKLNSDLSDVTSWLGSVLPELESLQRIVPSTGIRDFEVNIQKLKVHFPFCFSPFISVCSVLCAWARLPCECGRSQVVQGEKIEPVRKQLKDSDSDVDRLCFFYFLRRCRRPSTATRV